MMPFKDVAQPPQRVKVAPQHNQTIYTDGENFYSSYRVKMPKDKRFEIEVIQGAKRMAHGRLEKYLNIGSLRGVTTENVEKENGYVTVTVKWSEQSHAAAKQIADEIGRD